MLPLTATHSNECKPKKYRSKWFDAEQLAGYSGATTDWTVLLICYLLLNKDLCSSGDLTHVSVCCTNRVMDQPLTNATSYRENIRAEWAPGSRLSVIDLNSHVVHVSIIMTLFILGKLHSGTISLQKL